MITENLSTLKIHKLTQAQYDREFEAGNIDESALYLTPDEMPTAEEVGARPDTWMPTAEEVGADPLGTAYNVQVNLDSHASNMGNPHGVTAEQVGAFRQGGTALYVDEKVSIWKDENGGNIRIVSPTNDGDNWLINACDGGLNIYHNNNTVGVVNTVYMSRGGVVFINGAPVITASNFSYSNGTLYINM